MLVLLALIQLLVVSVEPLPTEALVLVLLCFSLRYLRLRRLPFTVMLALCYLGLELTLSTVLPIQWGTAYSLVWPALCFALLPNRLPGWWRGPLAQTQLLMCAWLSDVAPRWSATELEGVLLAVAVLAFVQMVPNRLSRLANTATLALWLAPLVTLLLPTECRTVCEHGGHFWVFSWAHLSLLLFPQLLLRRVEQR